MASKDDEKWPAWMTVLFVLVAGVILWAPVWVPVGLWWVAQQPGAK